MVRDPSTSLRITKKLKVAEAEFRKRQTVPKPEFGNQRRKVFRCAYCLLALFSTLIGSLSCDAAWLSPRTALEASIELSNNVELKAKFLANIDGEFWIGLKYARRVHISLVNPTLTEFSVTYVIKQNSSIVQSGNVPAHTNTSSIHAGGFYTAVLGRFNAKKGTEYDISLKLGVDLPSSLPKMGTVGIFLDPRVPYSFWRGW
jgi:hypothetical protein